MNDAGPTNPRTTWSLVGFSASALLTGAIADGGPTSLAALTLAISVGFAKLAWDALRDEEDDNR